MRNKKLVLISFILSLLYVLLGTIVALVSFPKNEFWGFSYEHPLWLPLAIITLPANLPLFGLLMVDNSISLVSILLILIFLFCWLIIYFIIKNITKK